MRLIRWLLTIRDAMIEVGESIRRGEPRIPPIIETLRDFEAELLIDGSDAVRSVMPAIVDGAFPRFLQRLGEIAAADQDDPDRPTAAEHVEQAYTEVMRPAVDALVETMRAELE